MTAATKLATYQDLLALGPDRDAELLAGEVVDRASPSAGHGRAQRGLARFVGGPFDDDHDRGGPGGWWILTEVEVRLAEHDIVRPDLVGWRRTRLADPLAQQPVDTRPDWVCEVLSPSDERRDRVTKAGLYERAGVPHYWLVNPYARFLEAFELAEDGFRRLGAWGEDESARIRPFEDIELEIGRLFFPQG